MVPLPFKKCRYAIKVVTSSTLCLVALVLMRYYGLKRHFYEYTTPSSSKETTKALDKDAERFESEIQQDEARIIPGLGDGGHPVYQVGEANFYRVMKEESETKYAMNAYLSDRMPYVRNLTDCRHQLCENVTYDEELPSASVVIVFRAQPLSVLLRAVWSVLASLRRDQPWPAPPWLRSPDDDLKLGYLDQEPTSPFLYLKELILVDDNSSLPELKGKLSYYVRTRLPPDLVKIIRLTSHNSTGVVGARLAGARAARGDVIVFLDAHCEPQRDWLRPLLQRIKHRPHALVAPVVDAVEPATFEYKVKDSDDIQVGGFTFGGETTWIQVSDREIARRGPSQITPTRSPVLPNGPFAIDRRWFWKMGGYDDDMRGWGADNLELSFRMWMCGGTVEVVPCSRVGLVYVQHCPYKLGLNYDFVGINTARTAEVWMDDYKELFYLYRSDLRSHLAAGNVNYRRVVRKRLRCHSFNWYLQHVYPEKFVPVQHTFGFVRFYNKHMDQCLDTLQREAPLSPLGLHPCHGDLTPSQFLMLSLKGELRDEVRCADIHYSYSEVGSLRFEEEAKWQVVMMDCQYKTSSARWRYTAAGRLEHVDTGLCLDAGGGGARPDAPGRLRAAAARCLHVATQRWEAERLFSPLRKEQLTKNQLAALRRIRHSGSGGAPSMSPAERDRASTAEPFNTTSRL